MTLQAQPATPVLSHPSAPRMHRADVEALVAQIVRFGAVGGIGFLVDVTVFNVLLVTLLTPDHLAAGPVVAKTASTAVATLTNWIGNRHWTFSTHRSERRLVEAVEFGVASLVGTGFGIACLWLSHDVLHLTTVLDDNISSNVLGLLLGSAVRFQLYRSWVYRPGG